jgi:hypothetical protein
MVPACEAPFFDDHEFGSLIFSGLLDKLGLATKERSNVYR